MYFLALGFVIHVARLLQGEIVDEPSKSASINSLHITCSLLPPKADRRTILLVDNSRLIFLGGLSVLAATAVTGAEP